MICAVHRESYQAGVGCQACRVERRPTTLTFRLHLGELDTFRAEAWYDDCVCLKGAGTTPRAALHDLADNIADRLAADHGVIRVPGPILVGVDEP